MIFIGNLFKRIAPLAIVLLLTVSFLIFARSTDNISDTDNTGNISSSDASEKPEKSGIGFIKGYWIPYMSLDLSGTDRSKKAARERLSSLFDKMKQEGADTAFLQVRPFCDALYKSKLFPVSHVLSGKQGKDVSYDFLSIAVSLAHDRGIKLHAWINPLRISTDKTPSVLSDSNPYKKWQNDDDEQNDRYYFKSGKTIYLNPSYPQVRRLIVDGVREIVKNYKVDGIVIDDYFYPENDMDCDSEEYESYSNSAGLTYLSQKNWRKGNINSLISSMYSAVHYERKDCVFGISPQCNMENNEKISADVSSWGSIRGYADYISPQIYVSEYHKTAPFEKLLVQWRKHVTCKDVKLYISLALYKDGTDADEGTWLLKKTNIADQTALAKKHNADGVILYCLNNE